MNENTKIHYYMKEGDIEYDEELIVSNKLIA